MSRIVACLALLTACNMGGSALTVEALEGAKDKVHAMQPKDKALEALKPTLGDPAVTDDTHFSWYAPDGEKCRELRVNFMGDTVGQVELKKGDCP